LSLVRIGQTTEMKNRDRDLSEAQQVDLNSVTLDFLVDQRRSIHPPTIFS
jgi:hypothetical protein